MAPQPRHERPGDTGIGATLRRARADRGLSLAELQARTKVRARYLAALEDERFHELPPYPFTRGFLRAVALELDLDPAPLQARLETTMSAALEPSVEGWRRLDGAIRPAVPPSRFRRLALTVGALTAVAFAVFAVFFFQQLRQLSEPAPASTPSVTASPAVPDGPWPATEPAAGPEAAMTPLAPVIPEPAPGPRAAQARAGGVVLELRATDRCWLLVVADDAKLFEGFVTAGQIRRWEARTVIRMRAGNAGAVALVVNGRTISPLGLPGEVVDRTFPGDGTR
jgi:transcriptional regulator with XRE-family HTH domain